MKYNHKQETKQFRRVMLDVMEICPQRFRADILRSMSIFDDTRLDFFHRLQGGRLVSRHTVHQKALLSDIILWLEAAHLRRYGKNYRHLTGEPRHQEFLLRKQAQKQELERMMAYIRKSGAREIIITDDLPCIYSLSIWLIIIFTSALALALNLCWH